MVVICGATATGKSAAAVALAPEIGAEIVSADSRTIYRGMDIGTAKPTPAARAAVPHHLLDVADPREVFTLSQYQGLALAAIASVHARARVPLLVGGTGLYLRALVDGLRLPRVSPDWAFRRKAEEADGLTPGALYARLEQVDPQAAARIHPRNVRRIIRALEVIDRTGRPLSAQQRAEAPLWQVTMIGLRMPRPLLQRRIDERVDQQIAAGLVEEVRALVSAGVPPSTPAMQGLGYKEIVPVLEGKATLDNAVALLKRNTRRYARRQEVWFRRDTRIRWIDVGHAGAETVAMTVHAMLTMQ
ncbi:MAG: tRNA (adenosine(37)-N6)-dimethylallyltransferase MiaA [bacterium]